MVYPHTYRTEHSETRTTNSVYGEYYAQLVSKKIPIQPNLLKIIQYIDSNRSGFLRNLDEAIQIKSVALDPDYKDDLQKMEDFTQNWLATLGLKYERFDIGFHEFNGEKVRLPTIILASLGRNPNKRTLCVYFHVDVTKPDEEQWHTDPWKVTREGNNIYGCGVAQGKGNLIQWFHAIEAFQKSQIEVPVNLKFIIEAMHHYNSIGMADFVTLRKQDFFVGIDHICICASEWMGEKHPCIIYGTIGIIHFDVYIEKVPGSKTDPEDDMVNIFKEIVDEEEHIRIPHFGDIVTQITPEEEKMYEDIREFNIDDVRETLPPYKQKWDKVVLLMKYWRLPSIWVGETEECTCEKKDATIIKRHFIEKIVPRQIKDETITLTINYVRDLAKKLNIENKVTCKCTDSTRYWSENVANHNFQAVRRATIQVYKEDPSMIREDRARENVAVFDRVLENNIVVLPMVCRGSNGGGNDENITVRNYYEGTKLIAAYLFQLAK